jgi:drug/metabolite transporter (DMT)-like permease
VALVVQTDGLDLKGSALLGDLFLLGNALSWATYNVFGIALLKRYSPMRVTAWAMTAGALALALLSPLFVRSWDFSTVSLTAWAGLFYAIIFASMIAQTMWSRAMHALGASGVMVYNYLNPVLGIGFASLLLGERFGLMQGIGAVCVLGGVTLSTQARRKKLQPPDQSDEPGIA